MADKTVGQNIKKFREARGLMQKELAEMIGRKGGTISNWELGLRDPGADNIKKIAAVLQIAPSELIGHNQDVTQDDTFQVVCTDESMLPEIKPGDRILASRSAVINDGDIVVAVLTDTADCAPVIRSYVIADERVFLMPLNHVYPFTAETRFEVLGKVLEINRKL